MTDKDTSTEPGEGNARVPLGALGAAVVVMVWGGWYVWTYSGGFRGDVYDDASPTAANVGAPMTRPVVDVMKVGARTYRSCAACHRADGQGLVDVYPPLAGSDYVQGDPEILARIVLQGARGSLGEGRPAYQQPMPSWSGLRDETLAGVLTYVRASWGHAAGAVTTEEVAAVRSATAGRRKPWTGVELAELREE